MESLAFRVSDLFRMSNRPFHRISGVSIRVFLAGPSCFLKKFVKPPLPLRVSYYMNPTRLRTIFFSLVLLVILAPLWRNDASAQRRHKKSPVTKPAQNPAAAESYYHIAGLGSSQGDSTNTFPYPTVILVVPDTLHTRIVVRFPGLGMLGLHTDTVREPTFSAGDSLLGYESTSPLFLLTFPKTKYFLYIDVWSRDGTKLLDSRPLEFDMSVEAYKTVRLTYIHDPTTGMGSPTMRREFRPSLLPFTIETNPGWASTETLDSSMTYALVFRDPAAPGKLELSLTMRPAIVGIVDSAMWVNFKKKAEIAFGSRGIATRSMGDFQVTDVPTRRFIKAGYEFVSKNADSSLDYVAAFLTPRAILLLLAPLDEPNQQLQFQYFQDIARSLKLE